MSRLKLCPFCGSVAKLLERDNVNPQGGKQYAVRCTNSNCIYRPDVWRVNRADVVSMWNRRADRKTENSSEIPNNCEDLQDWKDRMWAEAIVTEPTISKMEQVAKDINVRSKESE